MLSFPCVVGWVGRSKALNCWEAGSSRDQQVPIRALRTRMGTDGVALGWGQGADAATPGASAASLSLHCLPVALAHPPPWLPFCHLHVGPSSSSPNPRTPEGPPERVPRRFPFSGGEQEGGGQGVGRGRELGWRGWDGGVSESINHAPLRSCLTHTSPTSCQ